MLPSFLWLNTFSGSKHFQRVLVMISIIFWIILLSCAVVCDVNSNDILLTFVGDDDNIDTIFTLSLPMMKLILTHLSQMQRNYFFLSNYKFHLVWYTKPQHSTFKKQPRKLIKLIFMPLSWMWSNSFFLAKLQISSGATWDTSPPKGGTNTDNDDGYKIEILDIANNK